MIVARVWFSSRIWTLFLGLDGLVQALRVAPPVEDAPGELVDDQHLAVFDHVLVVFLVQRLGLQRLHQVVDQGAVGVFVSLKWNEGANNFMVYSRGGIPIGDYDPDRIVNLGDGHASWDDGFGYTYFNATTGFEFSAVSGLTYNFTNPHTDYRNGIDWHVDLEASRFLSKQFYVGAVGYSFNQLTGDTGTGATLGAYISRISAVGPEVGVLFPVGQMQGSLNLRGYWEFAAQNRSSGWNTWLVFSVAPTEKQPNVVK